MALRVISPPPAGVAQPGLAEDVTKSAGAGAIQGVAAVPGAFGDVRSVGDAVANWIAQKFGARTLTDEVAGRAHAPPPQIHGPMDYVREASVKMLAKAGADPRVARLTAAFMTPGGLLSAPTTAENVGAITQDKPLYQPQTRAGEYARTITQFAPAAAMSGTLGQRALNWLVPAVTSETAGQVTKGQPYEGVARVAGALAGGGLANLAGHGTSNQRLLANASRPATDAQISQARALMEEGQRRGVQLTMAEALQQVTGGATGMGRQQRIIEGTPAGAEHVSPVMSARPGQVMGAVRDFADTVAPPAADPYVAAQQAQQNAKDVLTEVRQQINANARPWYDALKDERLVGPSPAGSRFFSTPIAAGDDRHAFDYTSPSGERVTGYIKPPPAGGGSLEIDVIGPDGLSVDRGGAGRLGVAGVRDLGAAVAKAYPDATEIGGLRVTGARPQAANASASAGRLRALGSGTPEAAAAYNQLTANPAYHEALAAVRSSPILNADIAHLPDDNLAVVNEVVKHLDTLAANARPNPAASAGNAQLSSAYEGASRHASDLAAAASEPWRVARAMVASQHDAFLDPLKAGPMGAISNTPAPSAQTAALFPGKPPEGAAGATSQTLQMLEPQIAADLVRQHLMTNANEAMQQNVSGENQWGGAKFAAGIAGNPEQDATLRAGLDAVGARKGFDPLVEVLRATGKRETPGSMTEFNRRGFEELGQAGAGGETLKAVASGPGMFRWAGNKLQNWQTERNADALAQAIIASPADAERILLRARQVVPDGEALRAIERLALSAQLARQPAQQGQ